MRSLRRLILVAGVVGLFGLGAGAGRARAEGGGSAEGGNAGAAGGGGGSEGKALPEVSGRAAPAAAPRRAAKAPGVEPEPYAQHRREGTLRPTRLRDGTLRFRAPGWIADVARDGAVTFRARRASWQWSRTQLAFDVTDDVVRGRKGDPYAMEKLRFLEQTRPWRTALRDRAQARWQRAYFTGLADRLAKLWARRDLSAAQKRHLIFLLWEECLEPGAAPLRVLAQRARAEILAFVRRALPAGSPQAYTREELAWMGAQRKGQEAFLPYGPLRPEAAPPGVKGRPGAKGRPGVAPRGTAGSQAPAARGANGANGAKAGDARAGSADDARRRAAPPPRPKPRPEAPRSRR